MSCRSDLLSHIWSSFDPTVPYPQVCETVCLHHAAVLVSDYSTKQLATLRLMSSSTSAESLSVAIKSCWHNTSPPFNPLPSCMTVVMHYSNILLFAVLQGHKRFDPLKPFIRCPPGQPLTRYGNEADGGKLLCDLGKLPTPCIIYSLGSNGDYSFEQDALKITK